LSYRRGDHEEQDFWKRTLEKLDQKDGDLAHAVALMEKHSALSDTQERARHYGILARDALDIFPDSKQKAALLEVIEFCVARVF